MSKDFKSIKKTLLESVVVDLMELAMKIATFSSDDDLAQDDVLEDVLLQVDAVRAVLKYILPLTHVLARIEFPKIPDATDS